MQAGDITDGCVGLAPYYIPHFKVQLENRKGWQKEKGYDGPRSSKSIALVCKRTKQLAYAKKKGNVYDMYE